YANGVPLPLLVIADHLDPITARNFPGAVRRVSVNNQNFLAVSQGLLNHLADILFLVPGRDNDSYASRELRDRIVCGAIPLPFDDIMHWRRFNDVHVFTILICEIAPCNTYQPVRADVEGSCALPLL